MKKIKIDRKKAKKVALISTLTIVVFLLSFASYSFTYAKKVYPKAYLGQTKISGKTKSELSDEIKKLNDQTLATTIVLVNSDQNKEYNINPAEINLSYDIDSTVAAIWQYGRNNNFVKAMWQQFVALFHRHSFDAVYAYNTDLLKTKIASIASGLDQPEQDYSLSYSNGKFIINSDRKSGQRIDQNEIILAIETEIKNFDLQNISFALKNYTPQISDDSANKALANANKILDTGVLTLKNDAVSYTVDRDTIGGFIISQANGKDLNLVLNSDRVKAYIAELAKGIDVSAQDAKLTVTDGKVTVFQVSQTGKTLDQTKTLTDIESALFARINGNTNVDTMTVNLTIASSSPEVSSDQISKYGITELVGTATTSFYNSPSNRVNNIKIGAAAINGVLIKPGEEFSTVGHLGKIDASSGYLEELVIKDNKTLPEYGGGLCQVSSTLFRAALNAGMKITERSNHSYRVSYYEPPVGMDATIYDPAPDFKFINNYSSYVLIQSKIVGTKITFEFYGTKDSRTVEISDPVVYDYVEPSAPVYTLSTSLQPGETKLISHSHQGATADFHYKVTSASGTVLQDKTFHSVYNAIPEQWLTGPPTTCSDGTQNGDETGVDCGGSCSNQCSSG